MLLCRDDLLVDPVNCEMYYVSATDTTLIDPLTRFCLANSNHSIIIVDDFNVHKCNWFGSPFTSPAGTALRGFCELFGLSLLVDKGTCN